jgi:hypothetical protein
MNRLEIFNELMILSQSYFLFCYTGILPSETPLMNRIGYSQIALSVAQISMNISTIGYTVLRLLYLFLKRMYHRYLTLRKRREETKPAIER